MKYLLHNLNNKSDTFMWLLQKRLINCQFRDNRTVVTIQSFRWRFNNFHSSHDSWSSQVAILLAEKLLYLLGTRKKKRLLEPNIAI